MTGESRPEDLTISVVTFSPGDTLVEWWGHTSFVVEDRRLNKGLLYNFGMFGPRTPGDDVGFVKDFIKGRLIFWVDDESTSWTFGFYKTQLKRDVRIQELDLEPAEALNIAQALGNHVLPDNRHYRYPHYDDNLHNRPPQHHHPAQPRPPATPGPTTPTTTARRGRATSPTARCPDSSGRRPRARRAGRCASTRCATRW